MPLVTMKDILDRERARRTAAASFTVWSLESCTAVVDAAEAISRPVILMCAEHELRLFDPEKLAGAMLTAARNAKVPVAVHLDHGGNLPVIDLALNLGFTSVMIDGSALPLEENIAVTKEVVRKAKTYNATVEGELGRIGGAELDIFVADEDAVQTDPDEAFRFVTQTGVDALAIGIGTAHGFYKKEPNINIGRLKEIASQVSIPLVLHGGSGVSDDKLKEAIQNGVSKINICTEFISAFGREYKLALNADGFDFNVFAMFDLYMRGMACGKEVAEGKIRLMSGE